MFLGTIYRLFSHRLRLTCLCVFLVLDPLRERDHTHCSWALHEILLGSGWIYTLFTSRNSQSVGARLQAKGVLASARQNGPLRPAQASAGQTSPYRGRQGCSCLSSADRAVQGSRRLRRAIAYQTGRAWQAKAPERYGVGKRWTRGPD